jgi:uncharacterized protein
MKRRTGTFAPEGYPLRVTVVDLQRLRLRPGEERELRLDVDLQPFVLGGLRYESVPERVPVELDVSQAGGTGVFRLDFRMRLSGPCMRCLGHAELAVEVAALEIHDEDAPSGDDLRSDYVHDGVLDVGTWARDAVALELPDQILCRPDCAGLCPVCGKDLNVEPHEHAAVALDPRWAALEQLREQ